MFLYSHILNERIVIFLKFYFRKGTVETTETELDEFVILFALMYVCMYISCI